MRTILIGLAAISMLAASLPAARAQNSPWCSMGTMGGLSTTRCEFHTLAQCRATIRGLGGDCIENPDIARSRSYRQQGGGDGRRPG